MGYERVVGAESGETWARVLQYNLFRFVYLLHRVAGSRSLHFLSTIKGQLSEWGVPCWIASIAELILADAGATAARHKTARKGQTFSPVVREDVWFHHLHGNTHQAVRMVPLPHLHRRCHSCSRIASLSGCRLCCFGSGYSNLRTCRNQRGSIQHSEDPASHRTRCKGLFVQDPLSDTGNRC